MSGMGDLIWVGNTLVPRGVVIGFVMVVFLTPFVIAGVIQIVRAIKAR